jgi:WhiB family redox-sensing transcriptional regulator
VNLAPPDWTDRASCRDASWPDLWFATPSDPRHPLWDEPRAICQACPVRNECLERAMRVGEDHGMFGGLIPEQRRALARRRAS